MTDWRTVSTLRLMTAAVLASGIVLGACGDGGVKEAESATVAPALPPAAPPAGVDEQVTQTMEIGEERSPNEGGVLTDSAAEDQTPPANGESKGSPKKGKKR